MEVKNRLLCPAPAIEYSSVIFMTELGHNLLGDQKHSTDQRLIPRLQVIERFNLPLGNHQNMHRRLRLNVVNHNILLIFVGNFCRNLSGDDFGEQ